MYYDVLEISGMQVKMFLRNSQYRMQLPCLDIGTVSIYTVETFDRRNEHDRHKINFINLKKKFHKKDQLPIYFYRAVYYRFHRIALKVFL